MSDPWKGTAPSSNGFGRKGAPITPSDTQDLAVVAKAITVVAAGNLVFIPVDNTDVDVITVTGAPVGYTPPYLVRRVKATGTTATVATVDA